MPSSAEEFANYLWDAGTNGEPPTHFAKCIRERDGDFVSKLKRRDEQLARVRIFLRDLRDRADLALLQSGPLIEDGWRDG